MRYLVFLLLLGCAPELTDQDVKEALKDRIKGEVHLEEYEIIHQWEAHLIFKCGEETCLGTLIYDNGKWRLR